MKILNIKILRGPNYWSIRRKKLISIKLDLGKYEEYPTNKLPNFYENIKALLPSLHEHRCSEGRPGGFFSRVKEGTWLGHVIEHVALELQVLAGLNTGFGRTRSSNQKGVYHVVIAYEIEKAGLYAINSAVNLVDALAQDKPYHALNTVIENLKQIVWNEGLGPSTEAIIKEAVSRNIPYTRLDNDSLVLLGHGCRQKMIRATTTSITSNIGTEISTDKELTKQLLEQNYIPTPPGLVINTVEELEEAFKTIDFTCVIKPKDGNHGRGITTNIHTLEKATHAYHLAKKISPDVIIEKQIEGHDFRFLTINYKLIAVAKRLPALVIGDGHSTIKELIDMVNHDPWRGTCHENYLTKIKVDEITLAILREQHLTLKSILPAKQILYLKDAANISSGGTAEDVTDDVHPDNVLLAERISRLINLDICGIDIIAKSISLPITADNGGVIEVNAAPGFRMHLCPADGGKTRNVAKPVIDMLFPADNGRIPIVAVTGTNGKTTTVRLIAHLAKKFGLTVGFTTTDGIYIDQQLIFSGDCSGPSSATTVLRDPIVNYAVLECARGGIIRAGLGFDQCDISIITNITADHLGLEDVHTLEELAKVKAVVPLSTMPTGYSILNADDELAYAIHKQIPCHLALFSMHNNNERVIEHCKRGGLAAFLDNDEIILQEGTKKTVLININELPITFMGKARFMVQNALAGILAGVISGFPQDIILSAMKEFFPSTEVMPGRMNIIEFPNFKVMIDYAHNEGAYIEQKKFISQIDCKHKIGIIAATGDRRNSDIFKIGFYAAQMFDEIILRHDEDGRGRTNQEITELVVEGILSFNPKAKFSIISDEFEALQYALDHAENDSFIFYFPDDLEKAIAFIKQSLKKQQSLHDKASIYDS